MENLRLSHEALVLLDDSTIVKSKNDQQTNTTLQHAATSILFVTAEKEEPHTSSAYQLYSLAVAVATFMIGPPVAKSAVAAASYFLLGSRHYGSILLGFLRMISLSSAAVRLELGLTKMKLQPLMDRSQWLLCLDSLALVMTIVTTWMLPSYILAWAAIVQQHSTTAVVSDLFGLEMLGTAVMSLSLLFLEGHILRYSVHTQKSIEKAQILLTE